MLCVSATRAKLREFEVERFDGDARMQGKAQGGDGGHSVRGFKADEEGVNIIRIMSQNDL